MHEVCYSIDKDKNKQINALVKTVPVRPVGAGLHYPYTLSMSTYFYINRGKHSVCALLSNLSVFLPEYDPELSVHFSPSPYAM